MTKDPLKDVMIDIETLSCHTNAAVVEIAAVAFDCVTGEIGETLSIKINPYDWSRHNRHIDGNTLVWWLSQSDDARKHIIEHDEEYKTFLDPYYMDDMYIKDAKFYLYYGSALQALNDFIKYLIKESGDKENFRVWGNGSTFDITILQSLYEEFNWDSTPWEYWMVNDVRTIVNLKPGVKASIPFEGTKHNPIDDCKHQIRYLSETIRDLKGYRLCPED